MKLAIFLGAGASAAEKCPIQGELFSTYFKQLNEEDFSNDMNNELYVFFKEIFNIDVKSDKIDEIDFPTFEEVLGLLDLAEQRREEFKHFRLELINNKSDGVRFIRQYIILLMANVIHNASSKRPRYHELLVDQLNKSNNLLNTTFISANYDINIDNTIASVYKKDTCPIMLDYGIKFNNFNGECGWREPKYPSVKLYKIHGSLNWLYCPICNSLTLTPFEGGVMRLIEKSNDARCLDCNEITRAIIVPPTYFKNISNIYLSTVWSEVEKSLREADALIFCGYSFPDADIHIKYMIKRIQTSRNKKPIKIMVFNNHVGKTDSSLLKEKARYKRFLGNDIIYTNNSFEDLAKDPLRYINILNSD